MMIGCTAQLVCEAAVNDGVMNLLFLISGPSEIDYGFYLSLSSPYTCRYDIE